MPGHISIAEPVRQPIGSFELRGSTLCYCDSLLDSLPHSDEVVGANTTAGGPVVEHGLQLLLGCGVLSRDSESGEVYQVLNIAFDVGSEVARHRAVEFVRVKDIADDEQHSEARPGGFRRFGGLVDDN